MQPKSMGHSIRLQSPLEEACINHAAVLPPLMSDTDLHGETLAIFDVLVAPFFRQLLSAGLPNNACPIKVIFQLPNSPIPNNLLDYVFGKRDPGATLLTEIYPGQLLWS